MDPRTIFNPTVDLLHITIVHPDTTVTLQSANGPRLVGPVNPIPAKRNIQPHPPRAKPPAPFPFIYYFPASDRCRCARPAEPHGKTLKRPAVHQNSERQIISVNQNFYITRRRINRNGISRAHPP